MEAVTRSSLTGVSSTFSSIPKDRFVVVGPQTNVERSSPVVELRALDKQPGCEACAAVLKPWTGFIILYCSSSLSYINEYLAIEQPSRINCRIWLNASRRG